jgi:protein-S-isoprenylcysteine O-methyltransferase Ste14
MNTNISNNQVEQNSELTRAIVKRMIQVLIQFLIIAVILFISAGSLNWDWAWAYIGVGAGILLFNSLVLLPKNPEVVAERGRVEKEETKDWDKKITTFITIPTIAALIVAGLDKRFGWSPQLPLWIHITGLVLMALGQLLFTWAMIANKYFATTVRIQKDREHSVATSGPYRYVRHPGYVGMVIVLLATPLALGSLWALIPEGLAVIGYFIRTALEDKTLLEELDGYQDYTSQVHYRLLPGIW